MILVYGWQVLGKSLAGNATANTPLETPLWIPQSIWLAGWFWFAAASLVLLCLTVWATLLTAGGVLAEAGLSFVGLGVQPPDASWGVMLSEARKFIFSGEWWLLLFPGLAISITVIGLNLFGDALRDILDPRHYTGPRLD